MPHKRAKRSIREKVKNEIGDNLAPSKDSLSSEPIPKSLARVLNAAQIREDWKLKRKHGEDGEPKRAGKRMKVEGAAKGMSREEAAKSQLKIKPGESIQHFNRRVEDNMRPLVKSAVQVSNSVLRNSRKAEKDIKLKATQKSKLQVAKEHDSNEKSNSQPPAPAVTDERAPEIKEFRKLSSSTPRRLNDIAQAPPEFKKLPRGARRSSERTETGKRDGILSMAQKAMMEEEREKAIARYREMKAKVRKAGGGFDERDRTAEDD